jgi:hypothetical protein
MGYARLDSMRVVLHVGVLLAGLDKTKISPTGKGYPETFQGPASKHTALFSF